MSDEPTTDPKAIPAEDAAAAKNAAPEESAAPAEDVAPEEKAVPAEDAAPVEAAPPPALAFKPETKEGSRVVNPYVWGTGRRKRAVARVRIRPGDGKYIINKREVDEFFKLDKDRQAVRTPLHVTETAKTIDVFVNVGGGGISGRNG